MWQSQVLMVEVEICAKKLKVEHEQIGFKEPFVVEAVQAMKITLPVERYYRSNFALMIMIMMCVRTSIESRSRCCDIALCLRPSKQDLCVFFVQYYGNCYCGNTYSQGSTVSSGNCNRYCYGNRAQTCGGSSSVSLYSGSYYSANLQ